MTLPTKSTKSAKSRLRAAPAAAAVSDVARARTPVSGRAAVAEREQDRASHLVPKIGRALNRGGLDHGVLFGKTRPTRLTVYAYSADPTDVTRIVREAADGTKTIGRLVGTRFVPSKE